ncbi:hypothetical protein [Hyphomonas atlantica]
MIEVEVEDGIARFMFNVPERGNALGAKAGFRSGQASGRMRSLENFVQDY